MQDNRTPFWDIPPSWDFPTDITKKKDSKKFFANVLTDAKEDALLRCVAFNKLELAERIIKADSTSLDRSGQVTDYNELFFEDITPFQYALWSGNHRMWGMILKYLPPEEAKRQFQDHVHNKKAYKEMHGDHYDLTPLINGMQIYINNFDNWTDDQRVKHWFEIVRPVQVFVPPHIVKDYCQKDRYFHPAIRPKENKWYQFLDKLLPEDSSWFILRRKAGLNHDFPVPVLFAGEERIRWRGDQARQYLTAAVALSEEINSGLLELKQQLLFDHAEDEFIQPRNQSCVIS